jgi:hypothetical protein
MDVFLAFTRPVQPCLGDMFSTVAIKALGAHVSVALLVVLGEGDGLSGSWFKFNDEVFEEIEFNRDIILEMRTGCDMLRLLTTSDESDRILRNCRACVSAKIRYNYRDVLLNTVPFRTPKEKSLLEVTTLHDTQAAILILRECLDTDNPVLKLVQHLHSRTTMAATLYDTLSLPTVHGPPALCLMDYPIILENLRIHEPSACGQLGSRGSSHTLQSEPL